MAILTDSAARKLLHGVVARGVAADAAVGMRFGLDGLLQLVAGLFASLLHQLALPFEAIGHGFEALWHAIEGFFTGIFVLPFEAFRRWLQVAVADAATGISIGFDNMWQHIKDSFASFLATLAGASHQLDQPLEAFWKWLKTAAADATAGINFSLDGLWPPVRRVNANLVAAVASAGHDLVPRLESLWRWLRAPTAAALPVVLVVAAVLCFVALAWLSLPFLWPGAVLIGQALVQVICYFGHYLHVIAMGVVKVLACFLPEWRQWLGRAIMMAPRTAGMLISREAFASLRELYFQILRTAGPVVASAVFCSKSVALACAAPVAALFVLE